MGKWNNHYWKRLKGLKKPVDEAEMSNMFNHTASIMREDLMLNTPRKYGGLQESSYCVVEETPDGISLRIGYTDRQHINLNPTEPHYDDFTNRELMDMLSNKPASANRVAYVEDLIASVPDIMRNKVQNIWLKKTGGD